jgi:cytochrome c-type biogenesis protein CcsB
MTATIAFGLLILSLLIQIAFLLAGGARRDRFTHYLSLAAALLLFLTTGTRSVKISFLAMTNTYESLIFFAGIIAAILFVYRLRARGRTLPFLVFSGTLLPILFLAIASSPTIPKEALPPIPALRSHWLLLHVSFSFIGESFFAFAFAASVYYLVVRSDEKRKTADRITYTSIGIGYPIFTVGALIFGAVWAQYAWGRYWGWDPKETWALVTWLIYTGYLHSRFIVKLRGRTSAVLSIVGFCFTMFTFFGVNYLLSGLHSYG